MKGINKSDLFDIMTIIIENKDLFFMEEHYEQLNNLIKKSLMVDDIQDYKKCIIKIEEIVLIYITHRNKPLIKLYDILQNAKNYC